MSLFKTIAEVVAALDAIVQDCITSNNRAGYFAALYKRMTIAVGNGITQGAFEDGNRMEQLDIVFAQRYLDAYYAFQKGESCSPSWHCAFTGCGNKKLVVLQQLLLGINTHINLDLAIAAATVAPGGKIAALQNDFNRINNVIATLVDDIQHSLEQVWFPMRFFRDVVNMQGHAVLNFSITAARKTSWANAVLLANTPVQSQSAQISLMDKIVNEVGERIIQPGLWPQMLLALVRLTEYDDVARTIRLIDTTVVE